MKKFILGLLSFYAFLIVANLYYRHTVGLPAGWSEVPSSAWKSALFLVELAEWPVKKFTETF